MKSLEVKEIDRCIWADELDEFVPDRIFDVHTHMFDIPKTNQPTSGKIGGLVRAGWNELDKADSILMPGRKVSRLSFGVPFGNCDYEEANEFVQKQIPQDDDSAALMVVHPSMADEYIERAITQQAFIGFKPYRLNSITGDTVECGIIDFLPENQISIAERFGLAVMLHLSRSGAIGDEKNLDDLQRLTDKYPNVKWILAHCARSYYDGPLLRAAKRLEQIPNLWFEISSVCDSDAMVTLLDIAGPKRVMYGSDDIPVGITRGKYITFGYGWAGMRPDNNQLDLSHCNPEMTFVRYESLRAFKRACRRMQYNKSIIEDLFCYNAMNLVQSPGIHN